MFTVIFATFQVFANKFSYYTYVLYVRLSKSWKKALENYQHDVKYTQDLVIVQKQVEHRYCPFLNLINELRNTVNPIKVEQDLNKFLLLSICRII